ncbi:MAG: hypothetical protein R6U64_02815 [Bacteroidales bacterium]
MKFRAFFFLLMNLLALAGMAQEGVSPATFGGQGSLRVQGIPQTDTALVVVQSITLEHNNVTHDDIIFRELLFDPGDTLATDVLLELARQSRQNLLNTSLFNFVELLVDCDEASNVQVYLSFVERWYLWPFPILELGDRNVNTWLGNPRLSRLNYGLRILHENFRGRNENLELLLRFGYQKIFSLNYFKPYINKSQTLGFNLDMGFNMSRELAYATRDNKQLFYRNSSGLAYQQFFVNPGLVYRPRIHSTHTVSLGFTRHEFADTLLVLNPLFAPDNRTRMQYFVLSYMYKNDHRDIRAYPLQGYYMDVRFTRMGLGLIPTENMDVTMLEASARKFWKLAPRWFAAAGVNSKISDGRSISYFNQQGLGFKGDLVRGFEDYVVDGQHFFVFKSNLKFTLVPQRTSQLGIINNPRFSLIHYAIYLNMHADAGIIHDRLFNNFNSLSNKWLGGTGVGLDFVTYYDRVFRVEWSLNSLGESGLFFHLLAPI